MSHKVDHTHQPCEGIQVDIIIKFDIKDMCCSSQVMTAIEELNEYKIDSKNICIHAYNLRWGSHVKINRF